MGSVSCSKCGSADVVFSKKKQAYVCADCSNEFKVDEKKRSRRVFISYGHDEYSEVAFRLKKDLDAAGHSTWIDSEDIKKGRDWEASIEDGLRWAAEKPEDGRYVILMTPHAVRRPEGFCLNELAMALSLGLAVMPLMVAWCEPPLSICRLQWLDMQDCVPIRDKEDKYHEKFESLLRALDHEMVDYEGPQSRLLHLLQPLPFDADMSHHLARFTGRQWMIEAIDGWIENPEASRIFWVVGPPGYGKTALASWLCFNREAVAAFHLCSYGHRQKSDARRCVMSIAYQLCTQLPVYRERLNDLRLEGILHELDARTLWDHLIVQPLSGDFPEPERILLIVIDAIDEAGQGGRNELAEFIASEFMRTPEWLRLLVTSRPDPNVMHLLQGLTPQVLDAARPENVSDIRAFLYRELKPYNGGRDVPPAIVDAIIARSEGIFLYAEWIRQELAQGRLSLDRLDEFPRGLGGVYASFFRRQFADMEYYRKHVRPVLEVLAAANDYLTVSFLSTLFKWGEYEQNDVIEALGPLFPITGDTLKPFHRSLMEWLMDKGKAGLYFVSSREGHVRLAEYGWGDYQRSAGSWAPNTLAYLAINLCISGSWDRLRDILANVKFVQAAWDRDRFGLMNQWAFVEENSGLHMAEVYGGAIQGPEKTAISDIILIADLLQFSYHLDEALKLREYLVTFCRQSGDMPGLEKALGSMAQILTTRSEFDRTMDLLKEQETVCRQIGEKDDLAIALCRQAEILYHKGDFDMAMGILREQEKYCRELGNREGLATSYHFQVDILYQRGALDEALKLAREEEKLYRELGNKNGIQMSLNNQAVMLYHMGEMDSALSLWKEQEKICRSIGHRQGVAEGVGGQGVIAMMKGDLDKGLLLFKEQESIYRELGNKYGLQIALGNESYILRTMGDLEGAIKLHVEEEKICRDLGENYGLQASLGNQALLLRWRGELDRAMELLKEQEQISRSMGYKDGLASALCNKGVIRRMMGDTDGAMALHKEDERLGNELGDKYRLAISWVNQAAVLRARGDVDGAMTLLKKQENICREIEYRDGLAASFGEQAVVLRLKGDLDGAMALHREEEALYRQQKNLFGIQSSLRNQAIVLRRKGDHETALKRFIEHLRLCRELGIKDYGMAFSPDEDAEALLALAAPALALMPEPEHVK